MGDAQILMLDDNKGDVVFVQSLLQHAEGLSTTLVCQPTVQAGLDLLHHSDAIELVLLDLNLADGQGLEVFQQVHRQFPRMPIIVLSVYFDEDLALRALKAGAQDYLVKGQFDSHQLKRSIRYAIERQGQLLELERKNKALKQLSEKLAKANRELEKLATTDSLTQTYNRRQFDMLLRDEWSRLMREGQPLSLIMCDVDFFKAFNDTYGHPTGDLCLQAIAGLLVGEVKRPADIVARYGGEEFALILPQTDGEGAIAVAEAIRSALQHLNLPHSTSPIADQVTMSFGIASHIPTADMSVSQFLDMADQALYLAKAQGRDCVQSQTVTDGSHVTKADCQSPEWVDQLRHKLLGQDRLQLSA